MKYDQHIKLVANSIIFICLVHLTQALYEDQIKKFDWRQLNIGKLRDATFDPIPNNNRLIVTTEENVLAALCTRTGEIQWRQIMETSPRGDIKFFKYVTNENDIGDHNDYNKPATITKDSYNIITVTGHTPAIIRGWADCTGNLEWEWSIMPLQLEKSESAVWFYKDYHLYHVIPVWNSHFEVTKYFATTGQTNGGSIKITAPWIESNKCILAEQYFVCYDQNQIIYLDLSSDQPIVLKKIISREIKSMPQAVKGQSGVILVDGKLITLDKSKKACPDISGTSLIRSSFNRKPIFAYTNRVAQTLKLSLVYIDNCEPVHEYMINNIDFPDYNGEPNILEFNCRTNKNGDHICSTVLSTNDGAIFFLQRDKIRWSREESLTQIVTTELIDLPLADSEGAIEKELNSKSDDITGAFIRRITTQISLMKSTFLHVLGLGLPPSATQKAGLIRDAFGLHKMLVILTKSGKLYGVDNLTGRKHWQKYLPNLENFNSKENMKLLIQRTSKHFPHQPLCTIVAKNAENQKGIIYRFNPITGQPAEGGLLQLNYRIKQMALLNEIENEFVKGLLLLDENNKIHVIPDSSKEKANDMYLFTADQDASKLSGYHVYIDKKGELISLPIWTVNLAGHQNTNKIVKISAKNPIEHVHSQGRVLADRSVLYKYINPNLVAVATEGLDAVFKYVINIYLIDVVSGSVVFSMTHKRVRGPLNIVHSENWLVYSYWNDKVRRTEITTIELYEGKVQANSTVWSSLDAPPMPLVERQTYIIPTTLIAMRETITERGITNKHVLMATSSGGIIEMPWALLDPRRPVSGLNQIREEGSIPYIPELPLPMENFINYNQTIARIKNIYTAPSGLESTCLVVAYGLDMFVTRISPSKTFDLLKEDFDYFLITVVLLALTSSSFLVKYLSSRKALKQAWK